MSIWMQVQIFSCAGAQPMVCKNEDSCVLASKVLKGITNLLCYLTCTAWYMHLWTNLVMCLCPGSAVHGCTPLV